MRLYGLGHRAAAQRLEQQLPFWRARGHRLDLGQCARQIALDVGEVVAEGKIGEQSALPQFGHALTQPLRRVVPGVVGNAPARVDLAGRLRLLEQLILKARVGNPDQRLGDVAVGFGAQIGHAVFGDDHVAQVARNGAVAVIEHDVRAWRAARLPGGAHHDHAAPGGQLVRHGHEVVLPAHARNDAVVFQPVRHRRAAERHHHRGVDEAGMDALGAVQARVEIELIDLVDPGHRDTPPLGLRHVAQRVVEGIGAQEEAAVQHHAAVQGAAQAGGGDGGARGGVRHVGADARAARRNQFAGLVAGVGREQAVGLQAREVMAANHAYAERVEAFEHANVEPRRVAAAVVHQVLQGPEVIDRAAQHAGLHQVQKAVHEHFAGAVQPLFEGRAAALAGQPVAVAGVDAESAEGGAIVGVALVAGQRRMDDGIAELADADLQGAAVLEQRRGMQADGVVGVADRLLGRAEQRVLKARRVDDVIEGRRRHLGIVEHERQAAVDLRHHRHLALAARLGVAHQGDQLRAGVGVARQRVARPAVPVGSIDARHHLRGHIAALGKHVTRGEGVVGADVVLLRARVAELAAGGEEELANRDVARHRAGTLVAHVVQLGRIAKHPLDERGQKGLLDRVAGHRPGQ